MKEFFFGTEPYKPVLLISAQSKHPGSDASKTSYTPSKLAADGKIKSMDDSAMLTVREQDRHKLTPPPPSESPKRASSSSPGSPHHHRHDIHIIPLMEPRQPSPTHLRTPSPRPVSWQPDIHIVPLMEPKQSSPTHLRTPRSPRPVSWQQDIHIIPLMEPKKPAAATPPSDHSSPVLNRVKKSHSPRPMSWQPGSASHVSPKSEPPNVKISPMMTPKTSHVVVSSTVVETSGDAYKKSKPKASSPLGPPVARVEDKPKKGNTPQRRGYPLGPAAVSVDADGDIDGPQKAGHLSIDRRGGLGPAPISFEEY